MTAVARTGTGFEDGTAMIDKGCLERRLDFLDMAGEAAYRERDPARSFAIETERMVIGVRLFQIGRAGQ